MAVISLSEDSLPNARRRARRNAIGMVNRQKEGMRYRIIRRISVSGTPFATTRSASFTSRPINSTEVKAAMPRRKGTVISLKR